MSLDRLAVKGFRNLKMLTLAFHPEANLIIGDNGSGKTSILEAIYFISHGRSFRTSNFNKVINYAESDFTIHVRKFAENVHGEAKQDLGLQRTSSGVVTIRVDGVTERKLSVLAKNLAVQLITPDSVSFFLGGPKERRQFCDLGLFHVKQSYQELMQRFSKVLKQRNALLKNSADINSAQLRFWNDEFNKLSLQVDTFRRDYVLQLQQRLEALQDKFNLFDVPVEITYSQGWKKNTTLEEELQRFTERDLKQGYTSVGPHKADIKFKVPATGYEDQLVNVADSFSRGQIKLLLYALKVCQNQIIRDHGKTPILLVDDVNSEIDEVNLVKILKLLGASRAQLIITAISDSKLANMESVLKEIKLFHVKHGTLQ